MHLLCKSNYQVKLSPPYPVDFRMAQNKQIIYWILEVHVSLLKHGLTIKNGYELKVISSVYDFVFFIEIKENMLCLSLKSLGS